MYPRRLIALWRNINSLALQGKSQAFDLYLKVTQPQRENMSKLHERYNILDEMSCNGRGIHGGAPSSKLIVVFKRTPLALRSETIFCNQRIKEITSWSFYARFPAWKWTKRCAYYHCAIFRIFPSLYFYSIENMHYHAPSCCQISLKCWHLNVFIFVEENVVHSWDVQFRNFFH